MKRIYNYFFQVVSIYILILTVFSIFYFKIEKNNYSKVINNLNENKTLDSSLLVKKEEVKQEPKEEIKQESKEKIKEEIKQEPKENKKEEKEEPVLNIIDTSTSPVLASEVVNISHYGHDCRGCTSGKTASGYYVGDGRTYYNDKEYGSVRIVAADKKYPLGTIIRLNYNNDNITAIVLDRGGGIGDHAKYQIDLLTTSEAVSYELGVIYNANLEVLRLGY